MPSAAIGHEGAPTRTRGVVRYTPRRRLTPGARLRVVQVGEDGQDSAMSNVGRRQSQLEENVADVLADRSLGDDQGCGDGGVVVALGHQREHLALAGSQGVKRRAAAAGEELGYHLGVKRGAAGRDAIKGLEELLHPADAVLE